MKCTPKQAAAALLFQFTSSGGTHPRDLAPDALLAQLNFCVGSQVRKRTSSSRTAFAGRIQHYLKCIEGPYLQRLVTIRPPMLNSREAFEPEDQVREFTTTVKLESGEEVPVKSIVVGSLVREIP